MAALDDTMTTINTSPGTKAKNRYAEAKIAYIKFCKELGYWGGDTNGLSVPGGSP